MLILLCAKKVDTSILSNGLAKMKSNPNNKHMSFEDMNNQAMMYITAACDEKRILQIINCDSAFSMWMRLSTIYEQTAMLIQKKGRCRPVRTYAHLEIGQLISYDSRPGQLGL